MTRKLILPLTAMLIAGCSQTVETRIASKGQSEVVASTFSMSENSVQAAELLSAQKLVSDALVARGYTAAENGALHLEVSLAERPALLALGTATGAASLAPAKSRKPLQSCADREYRIGVALTRIADGALLYQSSAAEYHCKMQLAEAVPDLVKAALTDLGNPRGAYTVKRNARD